MEVARTFMKAEFIPATNIEFINALNKGFNACARCRMKIERYVRHKIMQKNAYTKSMNENIEGESNREQSNENAQQESVQDITIDNTYNEEGGNGKKIKRKQKSANAKIQGKIMMKLSKKDYRYQPYSTLSDRRSKLGWKIEAYSTLVALAGQGHSKKDVRHEDAEQLIQDVVQMHMEYKRNCGEAFNSIIDSDVNALEETEILYKDEATMTPSGSATISKHK